MPRPSKGVRLYKRKARYRNGQVVAQAVWIIKDGPRHIATGCVAITSETRPPREAEQALADYIARKYQPERSGRDIESIDCADVLSIYLTDIGEPNNQFEIEARTDRLNQFWGGKMLSEVNARTCAAYVKRRGKRGGARRDLETFRAAINHHAKEGCHRGLVRVSLPPKGEARDRWLTRKEAAALIWHSWRYREKQTIHSGKSKGDPVRTDRRTLRHIARFILIGLYTGTRAGAIASASPYAEPGRSYVDLERGIFYRKPIGKRATKKRQTPAPIPPRLLAHLRRWRDQKLIASCFVEFNGKLVSSVKTGFRSAVRLAGLTGRVTPIRCATRRRPGSCSAVCPSGRQAASWGCHRRSCKRPMATITPTSCRAPRPRSAKRVGTFQWSNRWLTREQPAIRTKSPVITGRSGRI